MRHHSPRHFVRAVGAAVVAALLVLFVVGRGSEASQPVAGETATTPLTVETGRGIYPFNVEVADSVEARSEGLMGRRSMPSDHGMLFDMGNTAPVTFWMHDTYIPLDIVFIRANGRVASIKEAATPQSDDRIPSGTPVRFVLELNAHQARAMGLKPGDRINHDRIDNPVR